MKKAAPTPNVGAALMAAAAPVATPAKPTAIDVRQSRLDSRFQASANSLNSLFSWSLNRGVWPVSGEMVTVPSSSPSSPTTAAVIVSSSTARWVKEEVVL